MTPPLPSLREVPLTSDLARIRYAIRLGAAWAALVGVACSERSARDETDSTARGEPTVTAMAESHTTDGETTATASETTGGETTDGATAATDGSTTNTAASAQTTSESTAAMSTMGSASVTPPNATAVANHLDASAPVVADASLGTDASAPVVADASLGTDASSALPPLPDTAECRGAQDEYGRCCVETYCIARIEDGTCKPASEAYGPYGSGSCECGTSEERMGPFADPSGGDQCCYTTWVITCEGRPLRIDDRAAVAVLVARADWC